MIEDFYLERQFFTGLESACQNKRGVGSKVLQEETNNV